MTMLSSHFAYSLANAFAAVRGVCCLAAFITPLAAAAAGATQEHSSACLQAIAEVERTSVTPPGLLEAIAVAESGRAMGGQLTPWPWTINASGEGRFFASKAEAVAGVRALQQAGVRSVDVGCMQINLEQHPNAFASLEEAFDPQANAEYGAHFITKLFRELATWPAAIAAYHSRTSSLGQRYAEKVLAVPGRLPVPALSAALGPVQESVDPYRVHSAELNAVLEADAALRAARLVRMRGTGPGGVAARPSILIAAAADRFGQD